MRTESARDCLLAFWTTWNKYVTQLYPLLFARRRSPTSELNLQWKSCCVTVLRLTTAVQLSILKGQSRLTELVEEFLKGRYGLLSLRHDLSFNGTVLTGS